MGTYSDNLMACKKSARDIARIFDPAFKDEAIQKKGILGEGKLSIEEVLFNGDRLILSYGLRGVSETVLAANILNILNDDEDNFTYAIPLLLENNKKLADVYSDKLHIDECNRFGVPEDSACGHAVGEKYDRATSLGDFASGKLKVVSKEDPNRVLLNVSVSRGFVEINTFGLSDYNSQDGVSDQLFYRVYAKLQNLYENGMTNNPQERK
jgi:hypothetical protein